MSNYFVSIAVCSIILFVFFEDCSNPRNTKKQKENISNNKNKDIVKKNERIYINDAGWNVPNLASAEKSKISKVKVKDKSGNKKEVEVTNFVLTNTITEEPYNLIGQKFGKMKIFVVRELKINNKTFAYLLNAQRVEYKESEKKYIPFGFGIMFGLLDEDGDGRFETLLNDAENDLFIPEWVY